jgi:hypothetical protein
LPGDQNVAAFSNRAEAAMLSELPENSPLIEGYFQRFVPAEKLGYVLDSDRYVLGRFGWAKEPAIENLLLYQGMGQQSSAEKLASDQQLLDGLLGIMVPDWKQLSPERYEYRFIKRVLLGAIPSVAYDLTPLSQGDGGFTGRVYLEEKSWNIVRFTGMSSEVDEKLAALRGKNSKFRVDSWRVNVGKDRWRPAYAYIEEVPPLNGLGAAVLKGQIRFWGYDRKGPNHQDQFTDVVLNASASTAEGRMQHWPSPQQSQRNFEGEAEENVIARFFAGRFIGAKGEVERMLEQVVTNLIATNDLTLAAPIRCRILLTSRLEAFTVGNTIFVSRGLIDVAPSESSLALVFAHQLGHNLLGHRKIEAALAFADVLRISDAELLGALQFRHSEAEETAADAKAMEILAKSPYNDRMSDSGLFMQAIRHRSKQLANLIQPSFGEDVADLRHLVRNNIMFRNTDLLDEELTDQVAAYPLGAKLVVNPWDGRVELLRSEPLPALALRERAELAVTPFTPFVDYAAEKPTIAAPVKSVARKELASNSREKRALPR